MRRLVLIALPLVALGPSGCKKKELQAALDEATAKLAQTERDLAECRDANGRLQDQNQSLEGRIAELQGEVAGLTAQLDELARQAGSTAAELAQLREEKRKREAELAVYRNLINELKQLVDAGKVKIGFRKGRMVVQMAQSILFDSGRDELKAEGRAALIELAAALQTAGQREFLVAGHTDNVPYRGRRFKNNWDLSQSRALVVTEALLEGGMKPTQLGAAGYSEYDPVDDNKTESGRANNRRIEIILMPNLGEIPGMKELLSGGRS